MARPPFPPSRCPVTWLLGMSLGFASVFDEASAAAVEEQTHRPDPGSELTPPTAAPLPSPSAPHRLALSFVSQDCGDAAELVRRVARRSPRIGFVEQGTPLATPVRAEISSRDRGRTTVSLSITHLEGGTLTRQVEVSSCGEALDALALIVVLSFDPSALDQAPPAPPKPSEVPTATVPPRPTEAAGHSVSPTPDMGVVAFFSAVRGPAPGTMLGPTVGLTLALAEARWPLPSVTLLVSHLLASEQTPLGLAHFGLSTVGITLVPLAVNAGPLQFGPQISLSGGVMRATGERTTAPRASTRGWVATGLGAALALELSPSLALTGSGEVSFPWIRDTYQFAPEPFHETAAASIGLGVGLAVAFP